MIDGTGAQLFARYRRNDYISSPLVSGHQDAKTVLRNPCKFDDLNATKNGCFVRYSAVAIDLYIRQRDLAVFLDRHVTNSDRKSVDGAK